MRAQYLLPALGALLLLAACGRHAARETSPLAPDSAEVLTVPDAPIAAEQPLAPLPPLPAMTMNQIGEAYVRLVLAMGELDPNYVDAYYGPASWRDDARHAQKPARQIDAEAQQLIGALSRSLPEPLPVDPALIALRATYLRNQLGALSARARLYMGMRLRFDDEVRALYDVNPPHYHEGDFQPALDRLEKLLPKGSGTLADRYNRYVDQYAIPTDRIELVMRAAIEAARSRTQAHLQLPANERFELALVSGKPWSAYNYYQGNALSRIEVNTDLPIGVARAIELASHEGYPGHHVYNGLLESGLVRSLGWSEYEVYPLFSPQSLIAEGTADFGVSLAFPGDEKLKLTQQLFKLAGFDPKEAKNYLKVVAEARELAPAGIEAARNYLEGRATAEETIGWLQAWTLASRERAAQRVKFFDAYRAYVVNYTYGEELVRGYVERHGDHTPGSARQWEAFRSLLTTPRVPTDLLADSDSPPIAFPARISGGPAKLIPPVAEVPEAPSRPLPPPAAVTTAAPASTVAPVPAPEVPATVNADAPVHGKVTDLVAFEGFMLSKPTPAQFHAKFPDVKLVLPGQITTKEFRLDHSRYFAQLDAQGRIVSGKFM
jgi:hypothetical protein